MVAPWVRRDFAEIGVTQYCPGRHLEAVQRHFGGRALLCIDVSGSMSGAPLGAAVAGGLDFLREATEAHYRCGLVLWSDKVNTHVPTAASASAVERALRGAQICGGTLLAPALRVAIDELGHLTGDRVVCVFGDGGIGDRLDAERLAAEARSRGIRFVVRGLGGSATTSLAGVLTPDVGVADQTVQGVENLRAGIASMVGEVTARPRGRK